MSKKSEPTATGATLSRRHLFAGAGAAGALAVAATALPVRQAAAPLAQAEPPQPVGDGYQLTEHVKRYYQTARV